MLVNKNPNATPEELQDLIELELQPQNSRSYGQDAQGADNTPQCKRDGRDFDKRNNGGHDTPPQK